MKLFPHQERALEHLKNYNKCAFYLDMGLGKTFVGFEKAVSFNKPILLIAPKSMLDTWKNHIETFYTEWKLIDIKKNKARVSSKCIILINYDLIWRREINIETFTLVLDESSYIKNLSSKRTKAILKLKPTNVILLSGTPVSGKYEELYSQVKLLGWKITKAEFYNQFIVTKKLNVGGYTIDLVVGYKNVPRLKRRLAEHGAIFMKTEEVFDLPKQLHHIINVPKEKPLKTFEKDGYVEIGSKELLGDTTLNNMLYQRQLCSIYSKNKLEKLEELILSTNDRLIVFYNFKDEFEKIKDLCKKHKRPISMVNGECNDLTNYSHLENSITLIQYQSGSMGLNLQKCNKIIYFSLTLSSDMFEQSKKRTHRIGQTSSCHYYYLIVKDSIEEKIYSTLLTRNDFTSQLFKK